MITDLSPSTQQLAIGVFDSGVGGLSVLREIRKALPHEHLLYVADSGHAPYGERSVDYILQRAHSIVDFFIQQGVKAVVMACNTASAVAVQSLRAKYAIPIIAMEPALKPAAAQTKSGVIGILATQRTLQSERFAQLAEKHGQGVQVLLQACPGFVEQVEQANLLGSDTQSLVARFVQPLLEQGADTLVLGCTHYPFLIPAIHLIAGPHVTVIDPSPAVAREVMRRLDTHGLLNLQTRSGIDEFWTSGNPQHVQPVMAQLWNTAVDVQLLPEQFCLAVPR